MAVWTTQALGMPVHEGRLWNITAFVDRLKNGRFEPGAGICPTVMIVRGPDAIFAEIST